MEANSKITRHTTSQGGDSNGAGAAVFVEHYSTLTMRDNATITGNRANNTAGAAVGTIAGGVFLRHATSSLVMAGGSITGNFRGTGDTPSDVVAGSDVSEATFGLLTAEAGTGTVVRWYQAFTITFDSAGGSAVPAQHLRTGNRATAPTVPTRAWDQVLTAGLWSMPLPREYVFDGWHRPGPDGTMWNFGTDPVTGNITLTAQWTAPTPIATVEANNVVAAVAHANANTGPFTLAIDQNVTATAPLTLSSANVDLAIVGIGGEREISRTATGRLFDMVASGAHLTLGENITLRGNRFGADLVRVQNGGRFYMEDGSQIRGHINTSRAPAAGAGAAVNIQADGTFTMSGGTITGNTAYEADTDNSGGVFMFNATSRFIMTGGRIYGNHRGDGAAPADVFIHQNVNVNHFTLSGDARIDRLILGSGGGNNSFITVGSDWSGGVAYLDLRMNATSLGSAMTDWTGNMVLQAEGNHSLTTADLGRLNLSTARFIGNAEGVTQPVTQTHRIVLENDYTVGMLRANP